MDVAEQERMEFIVAARKRLRSAMSDVKRDSFLLVLPDDSYAEALRHAAQTYARSRRLQLTTQVRKVEGDNIKRTFHANWLRIREEDK